MGKPMVPMRASLQVPASTVTWPYLEFDITQDGTLEEMNVRVYLGAELYLKLRPVHISSESESDIVKYAAGGKQYIDGDDDDYKFRLSLPLKKTDKLRVYYNNDDAVDVHDFSVDFAVDYESGIERAVS